MLAVNAAVVCLLLAAAPMQQPRAPQPAASASQRKPQSDTQDESPTAPMTPAKLLKYQHEETLKDIEKLSKLVGEIQEDVEKQGENVLSLNTLKKLDDVERLTRKIRGRLKQ
jgi:hypothetical protein